MHWSILLAVRGAGLALNLEIGDVIAVLGSDLIVYSVVVVGLRFLLDA